MPTPIQNPTGYAIPRAIAYADIDGSMLQVSNAAPLPVAVTAGGGSTATTPLAGTAATTSLVGPYQPAIGRAIMLLLTGSWTGTVKVLRSVDGGTTKQPLTINGTTWGQFSANCCEAVWDESENAARFYLDIALSSGNVTYRVAQ